MSKALYSAMTFHRSQIRGFVNAWPELMAGNPLRLPIGPGHSSRRCEKKQKISFGTTGLTGNLREYVIQAKSELVCVCRKLKMIVP
jgi:hypothetical protein